MKTAIAAFLATTMIAAPLAIANGGFPGLPDQAAYGQCMGYTHADENATANATPYQNYTAPDDCEELKPDADDDRAEEHRQDAEAREDGQAYGMAQADEHRPDDAGEDRGNETADEDRQDEDAREDGRGYGGSQADEHRRDDEHRED